MIAVATAMLACGCGKGTLPRGAEDSGSAPHAPRIAAPQQPAVKVVLPLTAARAAEFARGVELGPADVPGASIAPASSSPAEREREASRCGGPRGGAVGGGRSPNLRRGAGLDQEGISSSVEVLPNAKVVQSDLAYAQSKAGLKCYARVLRSSLASEQHEHVRLVGVRLSPLRIAAAGGQEGAGIRIAARVALDGSGVSVSLYTDAVSFAYGPAEIDLYATSFVQPEALRTEQELLTLMRERARLHTL